VFISSAKRDEIEKDGNTPRHKEIRMRYW